MNKYTIIGAYSGGETYYECVEAASPIQAIGKSFNVSEEDEAPPETIYAVIEGHHKEVGLTSLGFLYPVNENDAYDLNVWEGIAP